jgi:hypothetical protein
MPRNYRDEYDNYQSRSGQIKRRSSRNKARRKMVKSGRARKGDGRDVHHKDGNALNNSGQNLTILGKSTNRRMK